MLTRFGDLVYMFFMITPPNDGRARLVAGLKVADTIRRGLFGPQRRSLYRMPELFFYLGAGHGKRVHYEFSTIMSRKGRPRTAAFGWNGELTIRTNQSMLDYARFRKINIHAKLPEKFIANEDLAPEHNVDSEACARWIRSQFRRP